MPHARDLRIIASPYRTDAWPPGVDPTRRVRRQSRCRICGRLNPDERVFCSYCVRYIP